MGVTCPACGNVSRDQEFCDRCNADLVRPTGLFPPDRCPLFPGQTLQLTPIQVGTLSRPEASVLLHSDDRSWRVHWIPRKARDRWRHSIDRRVKQTLRALPRCRLVEDDSGIWLAAEYSGRRALPWQTRLTSNPLEDLRTLGCFLQQLTEAVDELHAHKLVWLTFDPSELEEVAAPDNSSSYLRLMNVDLDVSEIGTSPERLEVRPAFAAPEVSRFHAPDLGPATSVFHLALFAYYWLAGLLPQGLSGSGLESFGHALPPLRVFAPALPPGITGVLARGLAVEPRQRFPSPAAFCAAFAKACERAEQRCNEMGPATWEIGTHSRAGRAKSACRRDNEDYALVRFFSRPERTLVAVADGITTCDIGSGALASLITCDLLENSFGDQHSHEAFPDTIARVCRAGALKLLNWAVSKGYRDQLAAGRDLMGSTLLAGWLEGNVLTLANIGDSRAYLIDGTVVEQLTVDGDLGNELLASGMPPEEVKGLGLLARGLRDCVGGCTVDADGEVGILEDYCHPKISRWKLLPGDVVVLCSDGLVEEGAFLEPEKLGDIIRSHAHLPVEELAQQLAEAADAMQRLPSSIEPDGFGDNITCIVIKVFGGGMRANDDGKTPRSLEARS